MVARPLTEDVPVPVSKNEALKTLRDRKTERKYIESYLEDRGEMSITPKQIEINDDREFQQAAQKAVQSLPERARMTTNCIAGTV
ncbi:MAG: hypothetical protein U5K69_06965 [Balneolaceae bacterium]|nr:hypothetical protein [Balneolaceae bacterium]